MAKGKSSRASKVPQSDGQEPSAKGKPALVLPSGKLALVKDPRVWARALPVRDLSYRRVLGLDLASSCGASFCDILPGQPVTAALITGGQWNLSLGAYDTQSLRYIRLKQFLRLTSPDLIFYEEVKFTGAAPPPGMARNLTALVARAVSGAQVVHSLAAILVTWAEAHDIPCQAVPIGTLKRYATSKGNAGKADMIAACNIQFGTDFEAEGYEQTGVDNIADSMFLCAMAVQSYSDGL